MRTIEDKMGNPWWHKEVERWKRMEWGVNGAHLCIPFQCELCWLWNLEGRKPIEGEDDCYMACIKCANIDAMLGKLPPMIANHLRKTSAVVKNSALINKTPSYHARGPFPMSDSVGMGLAVDMLVKLLVAKGRIMEHVQFSTLRHLRVIYTRIGNHLQWEYPRERPLPRD
jgi:hypothetical protein